MQKSKLEVESNQQYQTFQKKRQFKEHNGKVEASGFVTSGGQRDRILRVGVWGDT